MLLAWWFLTQGATVEARISSRQSFLPSPLEVLQAFPKLHFEQGLVRSALTSFIRVTLGFSLAAIVAVPLEFTWPPSRLYRLFSGRWR